MSVTKSREVRLKEWPTGLPSPDDFQTIDTEIPDPVEGQLLVRNLFMSVDPYMRGRLRPGPSYTSSFEIGKPLSGGSVGIVEKSSNSKFPTDSYVLSDQGFREVFVSDGSNLRIVNPGRLSPSVFLGILGMPGQTAYVGLLEIGKAVAGETVYVSAAAGAVGSAVCQIAKLQGCRVLGSAGSEEKVNWLKEEAGVDDAFNYKETGNLGRQIRRRCPDGIDVYFDNVGGDHLEAALASMNNFGRIVSCGMISGYNDTRPQPGPSNLVSIVGKRLRMQGFIVSDHEELRGQFEEKMRGWIEAGQIKWQETVIEGIERAPEALIGLFHGANLGKMIVKMGA